ncbi:YebC/PmpR family DNA-binding transcriptional regulator [Atopobacter sp. AH10]|uniref:YebC/PmpR family DNA-binding transcriptional regulator n=1 Tax=Atopobacter sp. AH10 TaxID=2315861 RepID=UPI000EF1B16E|nr:YebC/PmpR family DNA-binding transcriptional regulator [Atopobacter sp. AH10]RLK63975.1 YebC/PmpR family DNA-binding transcriptional regulator [Atopobacter sp. AH10]
MSGHSKWSNIQGRKNAQDSKRAKVFQKLSREIYMAVKSGGPDPDSNPSLRLAMDKAKAANMPKDNVKRAIDKGANPNSGENYEEVVYEGYGPSGVGILIHALTDNRNRTSTNVRVALTHNGGTLGETGSVSYNFERKGYIAIDRTTTDADEDTVMMSVLEAGGEDIETSEEAFEIYTDPSDLKAVRDQLEQDGYQLATAETTMVPKLTVPLSDEDQAKLEKIIDALEDDDDVSEVFHTAD